MNPDAVLALRRRNESVLISLPVRLRRCSICRLSAYARPSVMSNEIETEPFPTDPLPESPGMIEDCRETAPLLDRGEISSRATRGAVSIMARGFGVRLLIGMLGNILLARLLLPSDFGMIALGNTILAFGAFLASGGLAATLVRFSPGSWPPTTSRSFSARSW